MLIALIAASCSPYEKIAKISAFDQLQYQDAVKKVFLPSGGYTIAYSDEGHGDKTIIFIHGLGSYSQAWNKNVAELKKSYRCIAVDLPGYGKSSKEPHSGAMTFYASVINELAQTLRLKNVYIAGHSMGGQIAITAALKYPELVSGLILAAPAGFEYFNKGQRQWFRDVMTLDGVRLTTCEAIQNNLATNFYRLPADADFMISDRMAMRNAEDFVPYCYAVVQSVAGMVDEPVLDYLKDLNTPTLILFGENDNLIPNRYLNPGKTRDIAENGHSRIAGSKLVMIPQCGHFLMFEKPEVFNAEVKEFLK
jgi:pimeloyl-ACP methyl ester carboxylesterase